MTLIFMQSSRKLKRSTLNFNYFSHFFTVDVLHLHKYNHRQLLHIFPNTQDIHKYTAHMYTQFHNPAFYAPFRVKSQKQYLINVNKGEGERERERGGGGE